MDAEETESAGVTTIIIAGPVEVSGQPTKPSCETCRFYVEGYKIHGKGGYGHCHRGHPTLTCHSQGWPFVSLGDWCGEYEKSLTPPPHPVS